jgi:hypothetical protein
MRLRAETGQATAEWVGLVLLVALALAGALAVWRGREAEGGRELGAAVAGRITCAVADGCATASGPRVAPLREGGVRAPLGPRGRQAASGREAGSRGARRAEDLGRKALRGAGRLGGAAAKRAWLVCLGYERWRVELERPRPTEPLPLDEALGIANNCLNPYEFLTPWD